VGEVGRNVNAASMGSIGASWTYGGYSGCGNVEDMIGSLHGRTAVICGNAAGVFSEVADVPSRAERSVVFAVNDVGMFLPEVDHWVSLHGQKMSAWSKVRWDNHFTIPVIHSIEPVAPVSYFWEKLTPLFALSGYFAMQIAYIMDAARIILCGCPGSPARRFFEASRRSDFDYAGGCQDQIREEMRRLPDFRSRVRSTSGWTQEYFGGI